MVIAVVNLGFVEMERIIVSCFGLFLRGIASNDDIGGKANCQSGACFPA